MLKKALVAATVAALAVLPIPAQAQTTLRVTSQITGMVVDPGKTARFDLGMEAQDGERIALSVAGLADGWRASYRVGGNTVEEVMVTSAGAPAVQLEVEVPSGAAEGSYPIRVLASSGAEQSDLALTVTVRAGSGGELTLTPDFPGLRGATDADFTFNVALDNGTSSQVQLELAGRGPDGWTVTAEPSGQAKAASISVDPGATSRIKLTAKPPIGVKAGVYDVGMTAKGSGVEADLGVKVEVIGSQSLAITTPDQRLNADVKVGSSTKFPITVINTGSTALNNVKMTVSSPRNWKVDLAPQIIASVAPGGTATVEATITPSGEAIAGDYDLSFTATGETVSESMDIRTSVSPSATWGLAGAGLIALTLGGMSLVFRKFGRR